VTADNVVRLPTGAAGWEPNPDEPAQFRNPKWPHWHAWIGVGGRVYARRPRSSPPKVVRAKTLAGLGAAIVRAERRD
jgi:hypothetical protein